MNTTEVRSSGERRRALKPELSRNARIELAREAAQHVIPQQCVRLSVFHLRSKDFVNGCLFDRRGPTNLRAITLVQIGI